MKSSIRFFSLFCFSILIAFACDKGKNNPASCNGENTRRDVKILIDSASQQLDTLNVIRISVDSIGSLDVPKVGLNDVRQEVEKKVFQITAKVHKVSKHRDGDYKIKLTSGNDTYINCEAPNMGCSFIKSSLYFDQMNTVRNWIEQEKDNLEGRTVTITGVGFIDIDHVYPRNAADNELELHPILSITY